MTWPQPPALLLLIQTPLLLIILLRPHAILPRRQHALWIQRALNPLIQLHLRIIIKAIRPGNLIHKRQMSAILAPAPRSRLLDQQPNQPVRPLPRIQILAIKHDAHDMMNLAHSDEKGADEVEAMLLAQPARQRILRLGIRARDLCNRGEEQVAAVGQPADPVEFGDGRDALEGVFARLQRHVGGVVFWEEEFRAGNGAEGGFYHGP